MDKFDWNQQLKNAISKYDFEAMKKALKNGAEIDNMILHRVINRDRVDLLEYFVFSTDLPNHCNIDYKYDFFGKNASFVYGCSCDAVECVKFMLKDPRVSHNFNIEDCVPPAFNWACTQGSIRVFDFLISDQETKVFCDFKKDNFSLIKSIEVRNREDFLHHLIETQDLEVVKEIMPKIVVFADSCNKVFEARKLYEGLNKENSSGIKSRKI